MQDTWNLCWKRESRPPRSSRSRLRELTSPPSLFPSAVGAVATGIAKHDLLQTYSDERQVVAQQLIDFDKKFSKLFSGKPSAADDLDDGVDLKEFKDVFVAGNRFGAGMSINYADSTVVGKDGSKGGIQSKQHLAAKLPVGERFYSAQVVNQASATADQLTTRIPFTGAFHLLIFPGDVTKSAAMDRLAKLADYLDGPDSVVSKYTPAHLPRWSVVDPITIRASLPHGPLLHADLLVDPLPPPRQTAHLERPSSCTTSLNLRSSTRTTTSASLPTSRPVRPSLSLAFPSSPKQELSMPLSHRSLRRRQGVRDVRHLEGGGRHRRRPTRPMCVPSPRSLSLSLLGLILAVLARSQTPVSSSASRTRTSSTSTLRASSSRPKTAASRRARSRRSRRPTGARSRTRRSTSASYSFSRIHLELVIDDEALMLDARAQDPRRQ